LIQVKDKWFRILIILIPLSLIIYVSDLLVKINSHKIIWLTITLLTIILITEGSRYIVYNSRRWFPNRWRLLNTFLAGIVWTALIIAISIIIRKFIATGVLDLDQKMDAQLEVNGKHVILGIAGYALLIATFNFPFLLLFYEMFYRNAQLRRTIFEKEKLEKEKLSAELSQLKGIINPHFLFNNLNSLSSLIAEDPIQAQDFLDELTKVFRYLLKNNQTELTTLAEELKFIQTYYQLLRTRYGKAINMTVHIDNAYQELLIPPLTLQLLVENAVKHNRLQKENPIEIELVSAPGKKLVARNNILPREGKSESTGLGLYSINARYQILNRPGVVIEKNEKEFSVIIPLITPTTDR
jgi:two-component system, LytTR family, sensor kinase